MWSEEKFQKIWPLRWVGHGLTWFKGSRTRFFFSFKKNLVILFSKLVRFLKYVCQKKYVKNQRKALYNLLLNPHSATISLPNHLVFGTQLSMYTYYFIFSPLCHPAMGLNCWSSFLAWLNWLEHWVQKSFLSWVSCWEIGRSQKSVSLTEMSYFFATFKLFFVFHQAHEYPYTMRLK